MKGFLILLLLGVLLVLFAACSVTKTNESATVKSDTGFIRLTGHVDSVQVFINDVEQKLVLQNKMALISIPSGTYRLAILRDGIPILKQKIIVSNSNTTEVIVP